MECIIYFPTQTAMGLLRGADSSGLWTDLHNNWGNLIRRGMEMDLSGRFYWFMDYFYGKIYSKQNLSEIGI